jgi:hypothetical protein
MKSYNIQTELKYIYGIIIPVIISTTILFLISGEVSYGLILSLFLLSIGILLFFYGICQYLYYMWWKFEYRRTLKTSLIGIINEEGCRPEKSKFNPEDWRNFIETEFLNYRTRFIRISEISNKFVAIVNPYGEKYPEEDNLHRKSFERIKKYVRNGGIFVSTAGLAFWYAWDRETRRAPSTAREVYSHYGEIITPSNTILSKPVYIMPPELSLTETLTYDEFGILSSTGLCRLTNVYQNPQDINFCGDISNVGGTDLIFEFRAIREPLRKCTPMLRAQITTGPHTHEVYPLACVPYEQGKYIFTGMHMDITQDNEISIVDIENVEMPTRITGQSAIDAIIKSQAEKVCIALGNVIENEKRRLGIS